MSNDLSKALKRKTDAQLRLIEQDSAPIVRETVSGDVYTVSPTDYMQTLAAGTNITITIAGNVKTISAQVNESAFATAQAGGYTGSATDFQTDLASIEDLADAIAAIVGG